MGGSEPVERQALAGERLGLEPLRVDHAEEMVDVLASPELYTFTGGSPPDLQRLRERYEMQTAGSGDPDEVWRNWIVRRLDDGVAVGYIQADIVDGVAELAWVVGTLAQGSGVASEAAAMVRRCLEHEGVTRFEAHIRPDHPASQAVARRVGLERTGGVDDEGEEIWSSS